MWQHVFPANRCLSHLTRLELDLPEPAESGAWDVADVSCFVSCCPHVVEIDALVLQREPDVSSRLHDLTALTSLEVHYVPSDMWTVSSFHASLKGIAAVTQLERLRVRDTIRDGDVTIAGLLPLTSLTKLTELSYVCWSIDPGDLSANKGPELDEFFQQVRLTAYSLGQIW
jgi:hypothetical protein